MAKYCVTYDLYKPGQNYAALAERLQAIGATRILLSAWFLKTTLTAQQIYERIQPALDNSDKVIVMELTGSWFAQGAQSDLDLLKQSL